MVTHDDYSVMSRLPKESTSVVTILRNPVDRVFSTYEFSVEVAARFLAHPNLASSVHRNRHINSRSRVVSTLDIWPWKFLVPWMLEDLFARRKARQSGRIRTKVEDSYDLATMLMPLHEFIHQPLAHDIIHNGATFQSSAEGNKVNISPVIRKKKKKTFTVKKLMESYEECISTLWGSQSPHHISSLSGIAPANFSKEARSNVHEIVIKEIQRLNDLDVELYKHGQSIFSQQQRSLYQEQTSQLRQLSPQERGDDFYRRASWCLPWSNFLELIIVAPLVALSLLVVSRRRTLKPKI